MATKFKKDEVVRIKEVTPEGPVQALRMDEDGNFFYQIQWVDAEGQSQVRWFREEDLAAV